MTSEALYEAMGEIRETHVEQARRTGTGSRTIRRVRWGAAAACLCLAVGLSVLGIRAARPVSGGGETVSPGGVSVPGSFPDGIDPVAASVAVFPAEESLADVADAVLHSLDEEAAYACEGLGGYLPKQLPAGYRYSHGSLYETTMKDGSRYRMLRVVYSTSERIEQTPTANGSGELTVDAVAALPDGTFVVSVLDYRPDTDLAIFDRGEAEAYLNDLPHNGLFYFVCDEVWVGFAPQSLSGSESETVFRAIG